MDPSLAQAVSLIASGIFMVLMAIAAYINARAKLPAKHDDEEDDDE